MFKHYILTRYNWALYTSNPYKIEDKELWMKHREHYFSFCAKSIKRQKCQNFEWIISVDPQTPLKWIKNIVKISGGTVVYELPQEYVKRLNNHEWVITTRLDSDDYIKPQFVGLIQDEFRQKEEVLDYKGVQWVEEEGKWAKILREKPNSPFITLVEPSHNMVTVLDKPHYDMAFKYPSRFISDKIMYIQVIHDRNIMNKSSGVWL